MRRAAALGHRLHGSLDDPEQRDLEQRIRDPGALEPKP
jgi:hypothetical protein